MDFNKLVKPVKKLPFKKLLFDGFTKKIMIDNCLIATIITHMYFVILIGYVLHPPVGYISRQKATHPSINS